MTSLTDLDRLRVVMEEALSVAVQGIQLPGIPGTELKTPAISSTQLAEVAAQLEQQGHSEIKCSAEVELYLRIANTHVLMVIESTVFCVRVRADVNDFLALASTKKDWGKAWERGMEPIKQAALQGMRRDIWKMDITLAEDSYTFQAAMVLLASEMVGPYVDRIATFLNYPLVLLCYKNPRKQQGHLGRERARWVAIWRRRVAIEDGLCRSVRTGSAARLV